METSGQDALVGSTVDGRYRVLSLLARGGMATVYEALDLRLDRVVALKIMHPHLAHDQAFVSRFQREAKAAARLTHGHVVAVYDQGEDNGLIYLAMEYVPGRTLRDVLRQYGPLTPAQALVFLDPVLEALAAAHAAGFVHRDIKPENVLISDDGRVKVADFGLARAVEANGESVTQGMIIGTVAYLSPEQVERGEADGRSDVYAAGILLFEMITGQVPHAGESPLSVAYQHVNSDVPPPSTIRGDIPPEVDALVVTATRRDASLRYQNAFDFLADVRRVRTSLPPPRPFVDSHDTLVVDVGMASQLAAGRPATPAHDRRACRAPHDTGGAHAADHASGRAARAVPAQQGSPVHRAPRDRGPRHGSRRLVPRGRAGPHGREPRRRRFVGPGGLGGAHRGGADAGGRRGAVQRGRPRRRRSSAPTPPRARACGSTGPSLPSSRRGRSGTTCRA